jgi:hypothetical protein
VALCVDGTNRKTVVFAQLRKDWKRWWLTAQLRKEMLPLLLSEGRTPASFWTIYMQLLPPLRTAHILFILHTSNANEMQPYRCTGSAIETDEVRRQ